MYTKEQILARLSGFATACIVSGDTTITTPEGPLVVTGAEKARVLEPVHEAVKAYYAPDEALRTQVLYIIHQLYGDIVRRHTSYEGGPEPPSCRDDYPPGYNDVTALFDAAGALTEIMTTEPTAFAASVTVGEDGTAASPLAEDWAARISAARAREMAALNVLLNFCKSGGFECGLYVAFEEYEKVEMPLKKPDLARLIYLDKGFAELIETMRLSIRLPSYLR